VIRRLGIGLLAPACTAVLASGAAAQDSELTGRLEPQVLAAVQVLLDSARAARLPTGPLVAKALEGAAKHAPDERIVLAVRSLFGDLDRTRVALGADAAPSEIAAGATAMRAGVGAPALARLRRARKDLTVPLAVLTDLVINGVPVDTAVDAIRQLSVRGVADADLAGLVRQVKQDVSAGVPPGIAATARAGGSEQMPPASRNPGTPARSRDPAGPSTPRP